MVCCVLPEARVHVHVRVRARTHTRSHTHKKSEGKRPRRGKKDRVEAEIDGISGQSNCRRNGTKCKTELMPVFH